MAASWGLRVIVPWPSSCPCWLLPGRASPRCGPGAPRFSWPRHCSAVLGAELPGPRCGVHAVVPHQEPARGAGRVGVGLGRHVAASPAFQRPLGTADRRGENPVSGSSNWDLSLPSHRCTRRPHRFRAFEDTASRDPVEPTCTSIAVASDGNFSDSSISPASMGPVEALMTCGYHFK